MTDEHRVDTATVRVNGVDLEMFRGGGEGAGSPTPPAR
jgi:hypothetical protein